MQPIKISSGRDTKIYKENNSPGRPEIMEQPKKINYIKIIIIISISIVLIAAILIVLIKIFLLKKDQNLMKKSICQIGFFLPEDDKLQCHECKINNCKECKGDINNNICTSCKEGYEPEYTYNNEIIYCKDKDCGENCLILQSIR